MTQISGPAAMTAALEDYLEAILRLVLQKGVARVNDIADSLAVHKSSTTAALKRLVAEGLVEHRPYGSARLTSRGRALAERVAQRHDVIRAFLENVLAVGHDAAEANACRMEHILDPDVFDRLRLFARFIKRCPRCGRDWTPAFRDYYRRTAARSAGRDTTGTTGKPDARLRRGMTEDTQHEEARVTLDKLKPGQSGRIVRVGSVGAIKRRIVDMGVVKGTCVQVIKVAPLGDPIEVKLKGYHLSLRKNEAASIEVEPAEPTTAAEDT